MKIHRQDNTFVIEHNGYPFHVIEGMEEYNQIQDEYINNPSSFEEEVVYNPSLEEIKLDKVVELKVARDEAKKLIQFTADKTLWDMDSQNGYNFLNLVTLAFKWTQEDKERYYTLLTPIVEKYDRLKEQVNNATTKEEINNITWG